MAERPVARDLPVRDLADELRQAPPRRLVRPRRRGEGGGRRFVPLERRQQLAERALVESRTHVPHRLQLSFAVHAEEQRAQCAGPPALPRGPAADHAVHRAERLDLHPRRRARAGDIERVETLGDDAFEALLAGRLEERATRADEPFGATDRAHRRERGVELRQALAEWTPREVLAVEREDVERLVDDGGRSPQLADRGLVRLVHPRLEALEAGHALRVERDDLAIDDRLIATGQGLGDLRRLRVLLGAVEEVARLE